MKPKHIRDIGRHSRAREIALMMLPESTYTHTERVVRLAVDTGEYIAMDEESRTRVRDAAWLHDVVEDTTVMLGTLLNLGIEWATVEAVRLLTRPASLTYNQYIGEIAQSGNVVALMVKVADLRDHLNQKETLPASLKSRYEAALEILTIDLSRED